jgi:uncharacterized protein (TIGR02231 family)
LVLATRAEVGQETGEDWTGIALSLSTARPSRGTAAVSLEPLTVQVWQPPPPRPISMPAPAGGAFRDADGLAKVAPLAPAAVSGPPATAEAAPAPPPPAPARERQAEVETNGTTVLYRVPGRVDVASGLGTRNLKVGEQTVEPTLGIRAVPKVTPAGYLTAAFKPSAEAALLPGRVSLFRDGVFVGTGAVPFVAPGDEVKLGFGEDERVRIERNPLRQTEGETGTFSTNRVETRDFRIRIKSLRDRAMPVTIEDQIPVAESTEITVERLSTTTAPTKVNVDDRRGVLSWSFELKPGEEKEIRVGWRMTWPADKQLRWPRGPR